MTKEPFTIEAEQEADGRWVAEVLEIPWILAYAETREEAITRVRDLAMRTLAEDGEI
ncbi:type II toxin-antitoxin system HicB family antitoxin [bacterium CPR1]|jgi:predicted RNase H-like HicB family nuclease|nr:type II toxin-antitoxin system HicB family antitoxin [bacterium CPR1]